MATDPQGTGRHYWLLIGDVPLGPFDVAQVHARLAAGEVTWHTRACPVGSSTWLPLVDVPGLGPDRPAPPVDVRAGHPARAAETPAIIPVVRLADPAGPPSPRRPPADPAESEGRVPTAPRPWNPAAIVGLGLIFTPMWAGVMAALNGKRLGTTTTAWLPLGIGFGVLALDLAVNLVIDSGWLDLLLYLGALAALWHFVLADQQAAYARLGPRGPVATGGWLYPSLAGVPLALCLLLAFVGMMMPLEPRDVCEHFNRATTQREMARYTTNNLLPALETLAGLEDKGDPGNIELTDEGPAPADTGGYLVECRLVFKDGGRYAQIEGMYHLVQRDGEWKIEDLYFTSRDRQPLDPWVSVARDYAQLAEAARLSQPGLGQPEGNRDGPPGRPGVAKANPPSGGTAKPWWSRTELLRASPVIVLVVGGVLKWLSDLLSRGSPQAGPKT